MYETHGGNYKTSPEKPSPPLWHRGGAAARTWHGVCWMGIAGSGAPAEHPEPTPNSGSSGTRAGTSFCTGVHNGQGPFPLAALQRSLAPHRWLSDQVRIEVDQLIYFVSDAPFSPMCSSFDLHWSNDPTHGNLLLSGAVLGVGSQHVLCRAVSKMTLCIYSKFLILLWGTSEPHVSLAAGAGILFGALREERQLLDRGPRWSLPGHWHSRCVQRNREPKPCCCCERFSEGSILLKISMFHMQWGGWRAAGTSNNSQRQAASEERAQPHSCAHRRSRTLCFLPGEISLYVSKVAWRKHVFQQAKMWS